MPYTILIVSDDPRRIAPLLAALAQNGVRAECVPDGAHGLEAARKDPPDLIICDLREPPMLDHQFVEATAQDSTLSRIPLGVLDTEFPTQRIVSMQQEAVRLIELIDRLSQPAPTVEARASQNESEGTDGPGYGKAVTFSTLLLWRSLPFQFTIRFPFTRFGIQFGQHRLGGLRRKVSRRPDDAGARITLAAHLLSQNPVTDAHAQEAVQELEEALRLLPAGHDPEYDAQQHTMVHDFLGDALLQLGRMQEAREHWMLAVILDPMEPPYGFAGRAQEMLDAHPWVDGGIG